MVLYHSNGRVVIAHENYLEQEAHKVATKKRYEDQIDIYNKRNQPASTENIVIVIEKQNFRTLYNQTYQTNSEYAWEWLPHQNSTEERILVNRAALIRGSTLAEEHFRYNPTSRELILPVSWPRIHITDQERSSDVKLESEFPGRIVVGGKSHVKILDPQMAYIRSDEIKSHIVPWLKKLANLMKRRNEGKETKIAGRRTTRETEDAFMNPLNANNLHMPIPDNILDKIHLYNAMLQLGLPKFVQRPLIDALILQMYKTPLNRCHLETLEITVGRFNSRGIAILDPVICHFIGTYPFRRMADRLNPATPAEDKEKFEHSPKLDSSPTSAAKHSVDETGLPRRPLHVESDGQMDFAKAHRQTLKYVDYPANRERYPADTIILPPELPVLGHSIKNWSGLRSNDSAVAAFTGFPLNIGKSYKFIRRNRKDGLSLENVRSEQTNRLAQYKYYWDNRPGLDDRGTEAPEAIGSQSKPSVGEVGPTENSESESRSATQQSPAQQQPATAPSKLCHEEDGQKDEKKNDEAGDLPQHVETGPGKRQKIDPKGGKPAKQVAQGSGAKVKTPGAAAKKGNKREARAPTTRMTRSQTKAAANNHLGQ
ncbi:hypothetical protein IAQ61_010986 [Plenodomus lingam]|nr:hypothetical protein IAQ61_010986 [Plenodomus lingam]